jgi:hypothetical protein
VQKNRRVGWHGATTARLRRGITMDWTAEAEARLKEIPFFVRPAARKKIEKFAQDQGITQITEATYEAAKKQFG